MAERPDDEQHDEGRSTGDGDWDDGGINDPLTRTDVDAPQKPFGSGPESQ